LGPHTLGKNIPTAAGDVEAKAGCWDFVGGSGYNGAVASPSRDDFPNNFVGDLVKTDRGSYGDYPAKQIS
jgi:hypothetical protein